MVTTRRLDGVAGRYRRRHDRARGDLHVVAELHMRLDVDAGPEPHAIAMRTSPECQQPGPVEMSEPRSLWWSKEL